MTEPGSNLQFDRAQFEAPAKAVCAGCKRPLSGSYFEVNGQLACEGCRHRTEQAWNSGSGLARFLKASVYGVAAAIAGALVYWGISKATGMQLSLISIAVGWMVGVGVRAGSQARGGWPYQLLAIFLTYSSIVGSYAPSVIEGFRQSVTESKAEKTVDGSRPAAPAKSAPLSGLPLIVGVVLVVAIVYVSPFLVVYSNGNGQGLISLAIIGIGMWQAWSMNRRASLRIAGPFSMAKPPPAPDVVA
jgi:hypothetical protein